MSKKILVIDDDPVATRLIEYVLKQHGYQVITAQNGVEGLKRAQNEEPDLVVLNVMLPGMDGFEICHRLRAGGKTAQLPILILSGRAQPADRATGFKMGADDYLTKPAVPSEIISRIECLLARNAIANYKIIVFLSPREKVGTTTAVVNVAIALSQMGKRVIAVDMCPHEESISQQLGVEPQDSTYLLETPIDTVTSDELESALALHQTGVSVLRIRGASADHQNILPSSIDFLFRKLGEAVDYFLVDLPFQPSVTTRTMLTQCDLAVMASDFTPETLTGVKSIITVLHFLGIPSERMGAVLVDPKGAFAEMELTRMKPYAEASLGITLLGIIPYDIKASVQPDSTLVLISSPNCAMACSVKDLAQQLIVKEQTQKHHTRAGVKRA
ncbi:MAG: response regulator [Chloroflexota bacterium]|nr:response regulator [Chloroflexota bacterium]